jgi:PhnB protein
MIAELRVYSRDSRHDPAPARRTIAIQLAIKAGATMMEPADQYYGDRCGGVKDSAGNQWFLATHIVDVQVPELKRRAAEFFKKQGKAA